MIFSEQFPPDVLKIIAMVNGSGANEFFPDDFQQLAWHVLSDETLARSLLRFVKDMPTINKNRLVLLDQMKLQGIHHLKNAQLLEVTQDPVLLEWTIHQIHPELDGKPEVTLETKRFLQRWRKRLASEKPSLSKKVFRWFGQALNPFPLKAGVLGSVGQLIAYPTIPLEGQVQLDISIDFAQKNQSDHVLLTMVGMLNNQPTLAMNQIKSISYDGYDLEIHWDGAIGEVYVPANADVLLETSHDFYVIATTRKGM